MARSTVALVLLACLVGLSIAQEIQFAKAKKFWVWPMPAQSSIGESASWLDEYTFTIRTTKDSYTHDILKQAFQRYNKLIAQNKGVRFFLLGSGIVQLPLRAHLPALFPLRSML